MGLPYLSSWVTDSRSFIFLSSDFLNIWHLKERAPRFFQVNLRQTHVFIQIQITAYVISWQFSHRWCADCTMMLEYEKQNILIYQKPGVCSSRSKWNNLKTSGTVGLEALERFVMRAKPEYVSVAPKPKVYRVHGVQKKNLLWLWLEYL